eukprot:12548070-Alexandrium_andersonii.AAC.1
MGSCAVRNSMEGSEESTHLSLPLTHTRPREAVQAQCVASQSSVPYSAKLCDGALAAPLQLEAKHPAMHACGLVAR